MAASKDESRPYRTLLLNGLVSAPVLDEIAALIDSSHGQGATANSNRSWMRQMMRDTHLPSLYYARIPTAKGERLQPFRLPSIKANELYNKDPT